MIPNGGIITGACGGTKNGWTGAVTNGLTGGSILNEGSLVFMAAVFGAAYGLAYFVRKEWI